MRSPKHVAWLTAGSLVGTFVLAGASGAPTSPALVVREYEIPREKAFPHDPTVGPDGIVWYTDQSNSYIGRLDPDTGETKIFRVATRGAKPYGIVSAPSGLFVALFGTNRLGHIVPETGEMHEIVLPDSASRARRLAVGSDGVIWYTDYSRHKLGAITKAGHREWQTPTPGGAPYGISIDPKGVVWYNEARSSLMVSFDPRTERMDTLRIPTSGSIVRHMQTDSTRNRLWLALSGTHRIGRIDLPR